MEATSYMWYFKPKFKNAVPHTRCISVAHLPHGVSGYRTGECGHGMFLSPQTVPWLLIYSHYNWAWAYIHFLFSYEFFIYYGYKPLTRSDFGEFAPIVRVVFSLSCWYPLKHKSSFWRSPMIFFFSFTACSLSVASKKPLLSPRSQDLLLFSYKSFTVLALVFRGVIHFELKFLFGIS